MRRTIICAAVVAALLACIGGAPFSGGGPMRGSSPAGVASPRYDTLYTLIGTSPLTPRLVAGVDTAHCWTGTPDDSVKVGIAWAMPCAVAPYDTVSNYTTSAQSDAQLWGGTTIPNNYGTGAQPMLVMPYAKRSDRDIVQALLCVYVDPSYPLMIASGDTLFVFADTVAADAALTTSIGQARWSSSPFWPTRCNATWSNIKSGVAWSPTLTSRNSGRELGPYMAVTAVDTTSGWMAFDVTSLVDDFTVQAFGFVHKKGSGNPILRFGNPDDAVKATRPFLLVKTFARTRTSGPWPSGAQVACAIHCDDGKRVGWMAYDSVATVAGVKLTYSLEVNNVFNYPYPEWVNAADIRSLLAKGHEIQNQGWFSRGRCVGQEAGFTRGCFDCGASTSMPANVDSLYQKMRYALAKADTIHMHADSSYYWLRKWITNDEAVNLGWRPTTFAFGGGVNTNALEDSLAARGYSGARDVAGTAFVLSWSSGYPFKITGPPAVAQLAGAWSAGSNASNEATTRAAVRAWVKQCQYGGPYPGAAIALYVHSPSEDCDREHFGWIIDELQKQGVYIDTMSNLLGYWRRHHHAAGADQADQWLAY